MRIALLVIPLLVLSCATAPPNPKTTQTPSMLRAPALGVTPVRESVTGAAMAGMLATSSGEDMALVHEGTRYVFERNQDGREQAAAHMDATILPGALIDAQAQGASADGLVSMIAGVAVGDGPLRPVPAAEVRVLEENQGGALLIAGVDPGAKLELTSRAVLSPGLPHLLLTTTVRNAGDARVQLQVGDLLRPGNSAVQGGPAYVAWETPSQAYAVTTDGRSKIDIRKLGADLGPRPLQTEIEIRGPRVTLGPGGETSWTRRFLVTAGGMPGVQGWLAALRGEPTGTLEAQVGGLDLKERDAAHVEVRRGGKSAGRIPVGPSGAIRALLPTGVWTLGGRGPWGGTIIPVPANVSAGAVSFATVDVPKLGQLDLSVVDAKAGTALPATVVVRKGGKPHLLGYGGTAGRAGSSVYLPAGARTIRLPAGTYEITAHRGPEYSVDMASVEVRPGSEKAVFVGAIERVVSLKGHVVTDLRSYSGRSGWGQGNGRDVTAALVCSGVEVAAVPETLAALRAEPVGEVGLLLDIPAVQAHPDGIGTFTSLPADASVQEPPPRLAMNAKSVIDELRLRTASGSAFVTVIWPRTENGGGYFGRFGLDRGTGGLTRTGGTNNFDGIEVLGGEALSNPALWKDAIADWRAMVGQGYRFTAVAGSGARGVGLDPPGLPFTYLDIGDQDPSVKAVVDALRNQRATVSTGPLVSFRVGKAGPGSLVASGRRGIRANVLVVAAPGVRFDQVRLWQGEEIIHAWSATKPADNEVQRLEESMVIKPAADTWLHVEVLGSTPLASVAHMEVMPYALTNPIWVDANRDRRWTAPPLPQ
jgi:hypothetical protein